MSMDTPSVDINSFRNPDGKIDWAGYRTAQISNGENCHRCGGWIMWPAGHRALCTQCRFLDEKTDEPRTHADRIRCPKCRHQQEAVGDDDYGRYQEGEHDVTCGECEYEYVVGTHVSYSFESPACLSSSETPTGVNERSQGEEK